MGEIAAQFLPLVVSSLPMLDTASHHAVATLLETASNAYSRALVEECCAAAVVERLPKLRPARCLPKPGATDLGKCESWEDLRGHRDPIPIASVGGFVSLALPVAKALSQVTRCDKHGRRVCCDKYTRSGFPFAAAYSDAGGKRTYTLVSGECPGCRGSGEDRFGAGQYDVDKCSACQGTGARVDVGKIARRYGGDGDARTARFGVPR